MPQIAPHSPGRREVILIVDDQPALSETLKRYLRKRGHLTAVCTSADEALAYLERENVDLVLSDICMPGKDGLDLLKEIKARGGNEAVIMMTAYANIEQSVEAMRRGASDYITKPFRLEEVANIIQQALLRRRQSLNESDATQSSEKSSQPSVENTVAHPTGMEHYVGMPLVGNSRVMKQLFTMIDRIAPTDSSVLITGATGTGKELVARQIHLRSERRNKPFIDINCSAIPEGLIEAELFGHQRGTFTGANETRSGLFEEASGGTLFLDEVNALDLSAQVKLLRVLQERQIRRVGGRKNISVDVRIISATNKNLHQAVANGTFRHDLLYRLCVVPMHLPELYERGEDLELLISFFLQRHAERRATLPRSFTPEAMKVLLDYRWQGNVRELENAIEYALVVGIDEEIGVADLPPTLSAQQTRAKSNDFFQECLNAQAPLSEVERRYVLLMLEQQEGHQINTATALGIDRRTLSRKLQQYGSRILKTEVNGKVHHESAP